MTTTMRVVTGNPSAEELAAVTAVLTARMTAALPNSPPAAPRRAWDDPARRLGVTRRWRDTTLPR